MISAVILTKNEAKNIRECIESLRFCDEVIVLDDESNDSTRELVKRLGAKVYIRKIEGDFAAQRNFGQDVAKGEWVFFVDADERVSKELASEIIQVTNDPTIHFNGFFLKRDDFLWGNRLTHGEIGVVKLLRLAKKGAGKWRRRVHEVWNVSGETYMLKNPLLHYPHQSLREFLDDINRMSSLDSQAKYEEGKKATITKILFWPPGKFFYNFVLRRGFLDGMEGFVVAEIMSFHSFLSWSKLWILQRKV